MHRATEDNVQGWRVNNEHAKTGACDNACEVVVVANDGLAEGVREFSFDREDLQLSVD